MSLGPWKYMNREDRARLYASLKPEEYARAMAMAHKRKNDLIRSSATRQVIDRGYNTVISDFSARFMMRGASLDFAIVESARICEAEGFSQIGERVINLDIPGDMESVMHIVSARKLKREGAQLTDFEREYMPKMVTAYRAIIGGENGN